MPELPEVETVRRGLLPVLEGARIQTVLTRRESLREPLPADMSARLTGCRMLRLRRRSKYILIDTDRDDTLLIHLGMSGRVTILEKDEEGTPTKHDHIELTTDTGTRIIYTDPRRFGIWTLYETACEDTHRLLAHIGPEPLSNAFSEAHLQTALKGRKSPIKTALLDQRTVAGLGNIYVCEALWRARISPLRTAASVCGMRATRLYPEIISVLKDAIESGGSTLRDYVGVTGELGYFQHKFDAYGRESEACRRENCTGQIKRVTQSGRSSFYCPRCQR